MKKETMISNAKRLEQVNSLLKELKKEEEMLKTFFKDHMEKPVDQFGDVCISLLSKTRNTFDTKKFISIHGKEEADKFNKVCSYTSVVIHRG